MITSGAIQKGVPTKVFRLFIDSVSWPATPKSASFTLPLSDSSTFAAEIIKVSGVGGEKEEWERKGEEGGDRVGEEGGNRGGEEGGRGEEKRERGEKVRLAET